MIKILGIRTNDADPKIAQHLQHAFGAVKQGEKYLDDAVSLMKKQGQKVPANYSSLQKVLSKAKINIMSIKQSLNK